ncbi:PadR family transcriptional regulator [Gaopeijia maritima]|uniref:PadR family transcriptional regulator n=1 Tax=Gaopeijia maritima TaxID=3119007 RepID=A0ABU9ECA5_9BACT
MRLTYLTGVVLAAIEAGHRYGFDIMDATGIPDGTVYPALRRLEARGFLEARWEDHAEAAEAHRPARRYYRLTAEGRALLEQAIDRFPGVGRIFPDPEPEVG